MKTRVIVSRVIPLALALAACGTPPQKHLYPIKDPRGAIGFIDIGGRVVVEPQYHHAGEFVDGIALVRKDASFGYIDGEGKAVVPPHYPLAGDFSEGLAMVASGSFTDSKAADRYKFPPYTFRGKFGYIDKTGKLAIPFNFGLAGSFSEGLAAVGVGSLFYEHKTVRGCKPYSITRYGFKGKFGYIDRSGKMVIAPTFDEAHPFSHGLALVKLNGKYRYIDKNGAAAWSQ